VHFAGRIRKSRRHQCPKKRQQSGIAARTMAGTAAKYRVYLAIARRVSVVLSLRAQRPGDPPIFGVWMVRFDQTSEVNVHTPSGDSIMMRLFTLAMLAIGSLTSVAMACGSGCCRSRCDDCCAPPAPTCCAPAPASCAAPTAPGIAAPVYEKAPPAPGPQAQANRQTYRSFSYDPAQPGTAPAPVYYSAPAMRYSAPTYSNQFRADRKFRGAY
jgi:hypothetical protein